MGVRWATGRKMFAPKTRINTAPKRTLRSRPRTSRISESWPADSGCVAAVRRTAFGTCHGAGLGAGLADLNRRVRRALVGVVDHALRPPQRERQVQGVIHQPDGASEPLGDPHMTV